MHYISQGTKLFYSVQGDGPAVVLLHPMPCDHSFWNDIVTVLSGKYRVILPDLRGMGESEAGEGPITMEEVGGDILLLLDTLQIDRAMFAGCSMGGYALYEIWRKAPARVQALAFCCAKPQADTDAARLQRQEWIAKIREGGTAEFIEAQLNRLIGPATRHNHPHRIAEARAMMQKVAPAAAIALMQGLAARPDSVETARGIRVPAFVLAGVEDPVSTPAEMRVLAETIRNGGYGAEYTELQDAGHFAPWEQPENVGRLLSRFFESVAG